MSLLSFFVLASSCDSPTPKQGDTDPTLSYQTLLIPSYPQSIQFASFRSQRKKECPTVQFAIKKTFNGCSMKKSQYSTTNND